MHTRIVFEGYIYTRLLLTCSRPATRVIRNAPLTPFFCIIHYLHQPSNTPLSFKLLNSSGSRNLLMVTSSAKPFLLLVFSTKSRASACAVAGSRGRSLISLSRGSPGTMDQRSKTRDRDTWPCVWICAFVSVVYKY